MASIENVTHQTISVATTPTLVFVEDNVGNFLLLQNVSDADMYLSFTGDAEPNAGIYLKTGASLLLDIVTIDSSLSAIHSSTGTKQLLVTRG